MDQVRLGTDKDGSKVSVVGDGFSFGDSLSKGLKGNERRLLSQRVREEKAIAFSDVSVEQIRKSKTEVRE